MGNSVIYRPAYDAEVEYLESDGHSYIDTGLKASSELGILAHIYLPRVSRFIFGGRNGLVNKEFSFLAYDNGFFRFRFGSSESSNTSVEEGIYEFDNTQNHNILKVNDSTFTASSSTFVSDNNFILFGLNAEGGVNISVGVRIYDFKIYQNSTLVRDFIPVRIGNVGYMYDKVTKQLFGNKGTGQFILGSDVSNAVIPQHRCVLYFGNQRSVGFERIYEEYEWLKGDGKAYIDTLIKDFTGVTDLSVSAKKINNSSVSIMGCEGPNNTNRFIYNLAYTSNENRLISFIGTVINPTYDNKKAYKINVNFVENFEKINGGKRTYSTIPAILYRTLPLFATKELNGTVKNLSSDIYIEYFRVDNSMHLVPCKLLQSIPAILDGNGKTRQAGECGMWDKVSNRFYGNVANSGTFTVKGAKCYEEYQWLKGGGGVINTQLTSFQGVVEYKIDTSISSSVSSIFYSNAANEFAIQHQIIDVSIFSNSTPNPLQFTTHLREYTMQIDFQNGTAKVVETNQSGNKRLPTSFNSPLKISAGAAKLKYFKLGTDMHLVPCKLIHGIPASMDANGIARPSGECGMWDKVNDKFYGNVKSSGSFTVSNI